MTDCYTVSPERSRFTVQAFAGGVLSGFAHNPVFAVRRFGGEVRFAPDAGDSSCRIEVQAGSLELTGNVKETDRREIQRAMIYEVLETEKYPQIVFNSTEFAVTKIADNWFRAQVRGDMQLHGMTKMQQIDLQLRVLDQDLRLSGEFPLSLSAYKMKRVSALGGMIQVKDELKFAFDLVGPKQDSTQ
jgi:polyisoprenoid-binding protein YceI